MSRPAATLTTPLVSVVILTYNRPHYLRESLMAAVNQTYTKLEILVCDNASDDETYQFIKAIGDARVVHVRRNVNGGVAGNYYEAAKRAAGKYVLITHDDDIMEPTLVERQVEVLDNHPDCVAVASNVSVVDKDGHLVQQKLLPIDERLYFRRGEYIEKWTRSQFAIPVTTLMYRKTMKNRNWWNWKAAGKAGIVDPDEEPLDIGVFGDIHGMCQLNLRGDIAVLDQPLLRYRQHGQQDSFADDLIKGGVLLYKYLARLVRRDASHLVPLIRGRRLHCLALRQITQSRESLLRPAMLKAKISSLDRRWRKRAVSMDDKTPTSWLFELLKLYLGIPTSRYRGLSETPRDESPDAWMESWLARKSADGLSIADALGFKPGSRIAILGSVFTAYILALDCVQAGHTVTTFLDSSRARQGKPMGGIPIRPPAWLKDHGHDIDVLIISSERNRADGLRAFLEQFLPAGWNGGIYYWRDALRPAAAAVPGVRKAPAQVREARETSPVA